MHDIPSADYPLSVLMLGGNILFGHGLPELLADADRRTTGGTVFGYHLAARAAMFAKNDYGRYLAGLLE